MGLFLSSDRKSVITAVITFIVFFLTLIIGYCKIFHQSQNSIYCTVLWLIICLVLWIMMRNNGSFWVGIVE